MSNKATTFVVSKENKTFNQLKITINMGTNIFNSNKTFYTLIDNEIYAVQITDLIVPIDNVEPIKGNTISIDSRIHSVIFKIATKEKVYLYGINSFPDKIKSADILCNTYETIDDCISQHNPIFKSDEAMNLYLAKPIFYDMETICPSKAKWETNCDGRTFSLVTWSWDGLKPIKVYFHSPFYLGWLWANHKRTPHYDVVRDKWMIDEIYYEKIYPTYDACLKNNSIKVHLF